MESYSSILLNSFYASPEFTQAYGTEVSPGVYEISSAWQSGINAGMTACLIVGVALGGPFIDRFGHRITLIGGLILNIAFIFITFFAKSIGMIAAGMDFAASVAPCFAHRRTSCRRFPLRAAVGLLVRRCHSLPSCARQADIS